jgi:hypothetical protein
MIQMSQRGLDLLTAALESGEYEQGRGRLHYLEDGKEKFCCLGVLCRVALKDGAEVSEESAPYGAVEIYKYDTRSTMPPRSVLDHFQITEGASDEEARANDVFELLTLVAWNDTTESDHKNFVEIAQELRARVVVV